MEIPFGGLLVAVMIALAAPLIANLAPKLRIPAVALEIVLGLIVGPSVLGWVEIDIPLQVFGAVGLAYLLFLAGLEIDTSALAGRFGRICAWWVVSLVIAFAASELLHVLSFHQAPYLMTIALASTSLGLVVPILHETGESHTTFGQSVLAASSVGEFGTLLLLSVFFSTQGNSVTKQLVLIGVFALAGALAAVGVAKAQMRAPLMSKLDSLADTSSQVRVRAVLVVLLAFVALASRLGFEAILGAFAAGVVLRFFDRDGRLDEEKLRHKIEAIGYGFLIPLFFVTSGMKIDVKALFEAPKAMALVPALVVAMLLARGLPALRAGAAFGRRRAMASGFLQATNLSLAVIIANIGLQIGRLDQATAAALVLSGLCSVLIFPPIAAALLPGAPELEADWDELPAN